MRKRSSWGFSFRGVHRGSATRVPLRRSNGSARTAPSTWDHRNRSCRRPPTRCAERATASDRELHDARSGTARAKWTRMTRTLPPVLALCLPLATACFGEPPGSDDDPLDDPECQLDTEGEKSPG